MKVHESSVSFHEQRLIALGGSACYRTSGNSHSGYSQTLAPLVCVWRQDLHTNGPVLGFINEHRPDSGYRSLLVQKEGEALNSFKLEMSFSGLYSLKWNRQLTGMQVHLMLLI